MELSPLRLAYADPPYPGQAKRWYEGHPDYAGEVDHALLVRDLAEFDGWALSTSAAALQEVLALCPSTVRIGMWHITNTAPPPQGASWWWSWEAVIIQRARRTKAEGSLLTRDLVTGHTERGFLGAQIAGQKPAYFAEWVFRLMGASPEDEFIDLFPGSGAVGRAWETWACQTTLAV